jgi:ATP-dependent HslUV protease subunit HslV
MSAREIAEAAIHIAGNIDIFTNQNVISEEI